MNFARNWTRKMLKDNAKRELGRAFGKYFAALIVANVLMLGPIFVVSQISAMYMSEIAGGFFLLFFNMVWMILWINPILVGTAAFFIRAPYGDMRIGNLFTVMESGRYWACVGAYFRKDIVMSLWIMVFVIPIVVIIAITGVIGGVAVIVGVIFSLPLIIPAIMKWYQYRAVPYILSESPGISGKEAMRISTEMTRNQKWPIFVLDLSFVGWWMLAGIPQALQGFFEGFAILVWIFWAISLLCSTLVRVYYDGVFAQLYFAMRETHFRRISPPPQPTYGYGEDQQQTYNRQHFYEDED